MAVLDITAMPRGGDGGMPFEAFAPAVGVADFWAEAGAAEMRRRVIRALWAGPVGTLLIVALVLMGLDLVALALLGS